MKNKYSWLGLGIIIGVVVAAIVCWLWCWSCEDECDEYCAKSCSTICTTPLPGVKQIPLDTAIAYYQCYLKTPVILDTMKGFLVNIEQLNAMILLYNNDTTLTMFRIYPGIFGDPEPMSEIVGVEADSTDDTSTIYSATGTNTGPCPPMCDPKSPIK